MTSPVATDYELTFCGQDLPMFAREVRLRTFMGAMQWPFKEDCKCTPDKMADAGFYFVGTEVEPDLVRCFWCRRELDGWEPDDDPWQEHKRRKCPFIELGKRNQMDFTVEESLKLEMERSKHLVDKMVEKRVEDLKAKAEKGRQHILKVGKAPSRAKGRKY